MEIPVVNPNPRVASNNQSDSVQLNPRDSKETTENRENQEVKEAKKYSPEEVSKATDDLNKWLQVNSTHVQFRLHERLNEYYVEVVDDKTDKVIREIPSKKLMDAYSNLVEMIGILVDEKR